MRSTTELQKRLDSGRPTGVRRESGASIIELEPQVNDYFYFFAKKVKNWRISSKFDPKQVESWVEIGKSWVQHEVL